MRPGDEKVHIEMEQIVVFSLGDEEYGVDVAHVKEIDRIQAITRIPRSPDFLEGVINLRGQITPIIDLRKRFALAPKTYDKKTRIMVIELEDVLVGLIVDGVQEVVRIPADDIQATPEVVSNELDGDYLNGVAKLDDRLIMLLNVGELLTKREMETLEDIELKDKDRK